MQHKLINVKIIVIYVKIIVVYVILLLKDLLKKLYKHVIIKYTYYVRNKNFSYEVDL